MSNHDIKAIETDIENRKKAVDPTKSFIVQAPAGSGKTSLLTQRILELLNIVHQPEEILAITFTRKATAEMKNRVIQQLIEANELEDEEIHQKTNAYEKQLLLCAKNVLKRDKLFNWNLIQHSNRLKIQTFDAFANSLVKKDSITAGISLNAKITDNTEYLYQLATKNLLRLIDHVVTEKNKLDIECLKTTLLYFDNNTRNFQKFIIKMLNIRQQWFELAIRIYCLEPKSLDSKLPSFNRKMLEEGLNLCFPNENQDISYSDRDWKILRAILHVLILAYNELNHIFERENEIDFVQVAIGANKVLNMSDHENISDLLIKLDTNLSHILVDEFQDTSENQVMLIKHLTDHWTNNDAKTLFLVGDPMQSIYKFRNADVSLFSKIQQDSKAIFNSNIHIEQLDLSQNFRSNPYIIQWVNDYLSLLFPIHPNIFKGQIEYKKSASGKNPNDFNPETAVFSYFFENPYIEKSKDKDSVEISNEDEIDTEKLNPKEIIKIINIIKNTQQQYQNQKHSIAILVRSRSHIEELLNALKQENISYISNDIELLATHIVITELITLIKAILFPSDHIAWFAILRSRWLGLTLEELFDLKNELLPNQMVLSALFHHQRHDVQHFAKLMVNAIDQRYTIPFAELIKTLWLKLGGAQFASELEFIDALKFFNFLKTYTERNSMIDFDFQLFESQVMKVYAENITHQSQSVEIMTIHKSKGLEFDTVIVPFLGRKITNYDYSNFEFSSSISKDYSGLLIAPKDKFSKNSIFQSIQDVNIEKETAELIRILYVALTRAKKHLHLLGSYHLKKDGNISSVDSHYVGKLISTSGKECFNIEL